MKWGRLIPSNFYHRTSTVNSRPFPQFWVRDMSQFLGDVVNLGPGTLLLLPVKMEPHAQNHPAALDGNLSYSWFPRTVDLTIEMLHFDPDTDDTTTIDLSAAYYGQTGLTGQENVTPVRGHQLVPIPAPVSGGQTGYLFYASVNNAVEWNPLTWYGAVIGQGNAPAQVTAISAIGRDIDGGGVYTYIGAGASQGNPVTNAPLWRAGVSGDKALLYPYSDFEQLFNGVTGP